jgi:hypothetical protein
MSTCRKIVAVVDRVVELLRQQLASVRGIDGYVHFHLEIIAYVLGTDILPTLVQSRP